jgi:enamine deaminase RidA (YjgF/YER057c/UK114 family)
MPRLAMEHSNSEERSGMSSTSEPGEWRQKQLYIGSLASLEHALGLLDHVRRIVKINGYVNCDPGFQDLRAITDAASSLLIQLFGENGHHARTTVGVASLPAGVAVELELIVQIQSDAVLNGNHRRGGQ